MHPFLDLPSPRLEDAILSLGPTAYWPLDDSSGDLRDAVSNRYPASVTGTPAYGSAAPSPIERGITWPGGSVYATTSGSVPVPTSSVSVMAIFSTTDATAAQRHIISRGAASQNSWTLRMGVGHGLTFNPLQSGGTDHASAFIASANTGELWVATGTFDGTTVWLHRSDQSNSSTSLTGTWHKNSTAGIGISNIGSGSLYPGFSCHLVYWCDRVITVAEHRYIHAIAKGG